MFPAIRIMIYAQLERFSATPIFPQKSAENFSLRGAHCETTYDDIVRQSLIALSASQKKCSFAQLYKLYVIRRYIYIYIYIWRDDEVASLAPAKT